MRRLIGGAALAAILLTSIGIAAPAGAAPSAARAKAVHHGGGLLVPKTQTPPARRFRPSTASAALPDAVDLTSWAVPAGDQGQINSCTAWAVGHTLTGWWASRLGQPTVFAPMYLYSQTHLTNTPDGGGAYLGATISLEADGGIDTRAHYSHDGYDFSVLPNAAETADAAAYRIGSLQQLYSGYPGIAASGGRAAIETALAAGQPVVLGIPIFDSFYSLGPDSGPYTLGSVHGVNEGGHAVVVLGYDTTGVTIENSWGDSWGDHGFAKLGWDFVLQHSMEADTTSGLLSAPPAAPVPGWPSAVTASADRNTATVSWQPPVGASSATISGYRIVRAGQDLAGNGVKSIDVSASTRSVSFSNLFPSRLYSMTVQPLSAAGDGEVATASVRTAAAAVPGAPTGLVATPSPDGRGVDLAWSAPADSGGYPVYGYRAVVTGGGGSSVQYPSTSPAHLPVLLPGTAYTITLSAVNAIDAGPVATAAFRTPDVPGAPAVVSSSSTADSVSVGWTAGSGDVSGYRVRVGQAGAVDLPADARSYTFPGLSPGWRYPVTVTALDAVGESAAAAVTIATAQAPDVDGPVAPSAPAAVQDLRFTSTDDGAARVNWTIPLLSRTFRDVHVRWSELADSGDAVLSTDELSMAAGQATSASIGRHPAGRLLHVVVWLDDVDGRQGATTELTVSMPAGRTAPVVAPTPVTTPSRPASVSARPSGASVVVRWSAPREGSVTGWRVVVGSAVVLLTDPSARSAVVRGIAAGRALAVSVVAENQAGAGAPATTSVRLPRPLSAPAAITAKRSAHRLSVRWTAPVADGGRTIIGYRISRSGRDADGRVFTARTVQASLRSFALAGLARHRTYTVTVRAVTAGGVGPAARTVARTP